MASLRRKVISRSLPRGLRLERLRPLAGIFTRPQLSTEPGPSRNALNGPPRRFPTAFASSPVPTIVRPPAKPFHAADAGFLTEGGR